MTNELLSGIHEVQGNDGWIFIDEHGQVRLTDEDEVDEDEVDEDGNITTDVWDRTYVITKEFLRRMIVVGSADDVIDINERGDVETVSRGQARTPEVDHNSEESDNNPTFFIPDDAVLVGNEIRDLGDLIERGLIERKPKARV